MSSKVQLPKALPSAEKSTSQNLPDTNKKIDTQFTIVKESKPEYILGDYLKNKKIEFIPHL